ncbi:hypothetical protein [Pseudomonas sp. BN411]|uniref:hypothetical protein n=1 Tax=Pseudomonas sp. BN411 TaxID=2567887 RepID=UPI002454F5FA|nr:hypothetical protein [Pseudomonas sp. BN411]MDH4562754.1 glycosyltransferase family 4 protein [Pseudomonas sp. BN411]
MDKSAVIVGVGADIGAQPYLNKLSKVLYGKGYVVEYVYWDRGGEPVKSFPGIKFTRLYKGEGRVKFALLFHYICWSFLVLKYFLVSSTTHKLFFLSRLDAAAPAFFVSFFKRVDYIYLDRDAAHMTYKLGLFKPVFRFLEAQIGRRALVHMVPGESRNFTGYKNVRVVENTPSSEELSAAHDLFLKRGGRLDLRKTIYINGWLSEMRGMRFILDVVSKLSPEQFRVIVAGRPGCADADALIELPNIEYLGVVPNAEALSYYKESDLVLSFYDPAYEINRKAEPNKWYDCVCFGVRFVTNRGLDTAKFFYEKNICLLVDYGNSNELFSTLMDFDNCPAVAQIFVSEVRADFLPWDSKVSSIIDECEQLISDF